MLQNAKIIVGLNAASTDHRLRWKFVLNFCCALLLLSIIFLSGCIGVEDAAARRANADRLAIQSGWSALRLDTDRFVLSAYAPIDRSAVEVLTIYIEGDGFAWLTPSQPSADPSPRNPLALRLALRHPDAAVAWLARPCQFVAAADWRDCAAPYWTERRFSEAVVAASDNAISQLKARRHAARLVLVGYSGGGAIAALVAARRHDVQRLITVAGNLDHREWTRWHNVAPLAGSLNPPDVAAALVDIPQSHWVGGRDTVVDRRLADSFAMHFPVQLSPVQLAPRICVLTEADHQQGWVEHWPTLLLQGDDCKAPIAQP